MSGKVYFLLALFIYLFVFASCVLFLSKHLFIFLFNKSMVVFYCLYCYRSSIDVIKCSKLKWNHEPQASGFTAKFISLHF